MHITRKRIVITYKDIYIISSKFCQLFSYIHLYHKLLTKLKLQADFNIMFKPTLIEINLPQQTSRSTKGRIIFLSISTITAINSSYQQSLFYLFLPRMVKWPSHAALVTVGVCLGHPQVMTILKLSTLPTRFNYLSVFIS